MQLDNNIFRKQIKDDISQIQENLSHIDNIKRDEFAFNVWVLTNLYNLDEEDCISNITENNDKGIDCFVHYEQDKELYLIQNKYYIDTPKVESSSLSDFCTRPLSILEEGNYKRSETLQEAYTKAKNDKEYKIFLHFYATVEEFGSDFQSVLRNQSAELLKTEKFLNAFDIMMIFDKYYGKTYEEGKKISVTLGTKNKSSSLAIRPDEYDLVDMVESYYVMTKITDIYKLWDKAEKEKYPLFEENIREYLGTSSKINKAIVTTLQDPKSRKKLFYFNNGITIICKAAKKEARKITIDNPQIVNGCQTVNSIVEVLQKDLDREQTFNGVFVIVKILVINDQDKDEKILSEDIVKYTNSQNSINEKSFGAAKKSFTKLKDQLLGYGLLLLVKQSDKNANKNKFGGKANKPSLSKLLLKSNHKFKEDFYRYSTLTNIQVQLETLLQIVGAYEYDAFFSYSKKSQLLKQSSKIYQTFSLKVQALYTLEGMVKLILLYKKTEADKKKSESGRFPSPFFTINLLGRFLEINNIKKTEFIEKIQYSDLQLIYDYFEPMSEIYFDEFEEDYKSDYQKMIKTEVDSKLMDKVIKNSQKQRKQAFAQIKEVISNFSKNI